MRIPFLAWLHRRGPQPTKQPREPLYRCKICNDTGSIKMPMEKGELWHRYVDCPAPHHKRAGAENG